jgi:hypothetical protein
MKAEKATLNFGETLTPQVDLKALYLIDFSRLESVNDLILIISSMGISFSPTHPHWNLVSKFANLDNPIYPNKMPHEQDFHPAEKKDIKLPKLKSIK